MFIIVALILSILTLGLGIYALVVFFQNPKPRKSDYLIGAAAAAFLLLSEIAIILLTPEVIDRFQNIGVLIVTDVIALLRIFVITVVGIKLSRELGIRWSALDDPKSGSLWRPLLYVGIIMPVLVISSYFFLDWLKPSLGVALSALQSEEPLSITQKISAGIGVAEFAVFEELTYRGGVTILFYRILPERPFRYFFSAVIATTIWTLSHTGSLDPGWVKYVQILPLGIACAWLMRRFGIEYAILLHVLFNVAFAVIDIDLPVK